MASIVPLKGLRYDEKKAGSIKDIVTPPYDVISTAEQEKYYNTNPYNIIRLEYGYKLPTDTGTDNRYTRAADCLDQWQSQGVMRQEDKPSLYLYQQQFSVGDKILTRTGIICGVKLEPYKNGVVLPHEETMPKHKADRLALMQASKANFSPIFGLYSDSERKIDNLLIKLTQDLPMSINFNDHWGNGHRLWVIDDEKILQEVQKLMEPQRIFIADGHHRYETALNYAQENPSADYIMMTLVNLYDPGLVILPTHRMISKNETNPNELLNALNEDFFVEKATTADENEIADLMADLAGLNENSSSGSEHRQVFGLYLGKGNFYTFKLRDEQTITQKMPSDKSQAWRKLDVSVLQKLILENLMSIDQETVAGGEVVKYTRDAQEAVQAVDEGRCNMSFLMNPTLITEVTEVAANGEKMPQKSTFFYPKLITGLVINKF